MKSKLLLTATYRWFATARLAMAFSSAGLTVEAICPSGHPVTVLGPAYGRHYPYHAFTPLSSLMSAIRSAQPDLIIPCDDVAAMHLRRLYQITSGSTRASLVTLRELLERSLGDPQFFPLHASRHEFLALAAREGITTPATRVVASEDEAKNAFYQLGVPVVVKADGTSGGEGVRLAHSAAEACEAYRTLRPPAGAAVTAKHALVDRDLNLIVPWLLRRKRTVTLQSFVFGHDANIAVACWKGKVLASISVEVLRSRRNWGPAVLVRLLNDRRLLQAAETMARKLGLSGLCGFDFVVDERTGEPCLIEMNPRATQTCHLPLGPERDLPYSLGLALAGDQASADPAPARAAVTANDTIALFPSAWQENPLSEALRSAYHDVPWESPKLVRLGVAKESRLTLETWERLRAKVRLHPTSTVPVLKENRDV